ncbi:TPA: hypothetical protein ACXN3R_003233 [Stenotrophomonas maltophilia]|uniref:hypothetical protein n=1 Tax=Stenotrophomonas maltophilia TaxID=40324 RepID=UPI0013DB8F7F|nr:hypothetical protein [Stenotrophomonas maltophilia]MBN5163823.1 hypothetical protein [Stenotrophomonas maltophilia]
MDFSTKPTSLIFGDTEALPLGGELRASLEFLERNFKFLLSQLALVAHQDDERFCTFAPFLVRSMLEVSLTGLVGRIDPFRVLSIQRIQTGPNYDRTKPWRAAMRWQGDVMAEDPPNAQAWTEKMDPQGMVRALLGMYYDELLWRPALKRLYDFDHSPYVGNWISELKGRPINSFCGGKRGGLGAVYSELSKAVHYESVLDLVAPDRLTISELVERAIRDIAELGFVTCFMEHPVGRIDYGSACEKITWFEQVEVIV